MPARSVRRLPAKALRWRCPVGRVAKSFGRRLSLVETIGQPEAIAALRLGLELYAPGYNVFVAGPPGLEKGDLVRELLDEMTPRCERPTSPNKCSPTPARAGSCSSA